MNSFHWQTYKYTYTQTQSYTHRSTYWNFQFWITVWSCFHWRSVFILVSPSHQHLSSPVSLLNKNPQTLLKSIEMMISVVTYIWELEKTILYENSFPTLFPKMGYTSWHLSTLCPLISSVNNTFHAGYYEYWLRKHIWTYAVHSVDKETSLIFMTLYTYRSRKNGHI